MIHSPPPPPAPPPPNCPDCAQGLVRYPGLVEPNCLCQVVIQTDVTLLTLTPDSFTAPLQSLFVQGLAITLGVPPSQVT